MRRRPPSRGSRRSGPAGRTRRRRRRRRRRDASQADTQAGRQIEHQADGVRCALRVPLNSRARTNSHSDPATPPNARFLASGLPKPATASSGRAVSCGPPRPRRTSDSTAQQICCSQAQASRPPSPPRPSATTLPHRPVRPPAHSTHGLLVTEHRCSARPKAKQPQTHHSTKAHGEAGTEASTLTGLQYPPGRTAPVPRRLQPRHRPERHACVPARSGRPSLLTTGGVGSGRQPRRRRRRSVPLPAGRYSERTGHPGSAAAHHPLPGCPLRPAGRAHPPQEPASAAERVRRPPSARRRAEPRPGPVKCGRPGPRRRRSTPGAAAPPRPGARSRVGLRRSGAGSGRADRRRRRTRGRGRDR